jgi:hypothetical protein
MGIPWPLGAYENRRSFCSIDNLSYVSRAAYCERRYSFGDLSGVR